MLLMDMAISAPLCVVVPDDGTFVVHAATMEAFVGVIAGHSLVTACGEDGAKLLGIPIGSKNPVLWPLSTRGLPKGMERCRMCWKETGRKRPRSRVAKKETVDA